MVFKIKDRITEIYELSFLHYYVDAEFNEHPIDDTVTIRRVVSTDDHMRVSETYVVNAVIDELFYKLKEFVFGRLGKTE